MHAAQTTGGGVLHGIGPPSIAFATASPPPFPELDQMLSVAAIDLGLHVEMPTLDQDGEFADQPSRAKHSNRISSAGRLAKASASAVRASLRGITRHPPTTQGRESANKMGLPTRHLEPEGARVLKSTGGKPKTPTLSRAVGFCEAYRCSQGAGQV